VSGRAKARREAKAADRIARGKQRAQAGLQRKWHLTLKQQREMESTYARAAAELVRSGAFTTVKTSVADRVVVHNTYEPHCVMQWGEQVAAMDETAGLNKPDGDAT
jgi:hypothetical protein